MSQIIKELVYVLLRNSLFSYLMSKTDQWTKLWPLSIDYAAQILDRKTPREVQFDIRKMCKHLISCLVNKRVSSFPKNWLFHGHKKRKGSLEGSLNWVLFAAVLKFCGNCIFPQNFHIRKLGEITGFYAAYWENRLWIKINNKLKISLQITVGCYSFWHQRQTALLEISSSGYEWGLIKN